MISLCVHVYALPPSSPLVRDDLVPRPVRTIAQWFPPNVPLPPIMASGNGRWQLRFLRSPYLQPAGIESRCPAVAREQLDYDPPRVYRAHVFGVQIVSG